MDIRILSTFALAILAVFALPTNAIADEFIKCDDCSEHTRESHARVWAMNNISIAEAAAGIFKTVHVVDIPRQEISSFSVSRELIQGPNPYPAKWLPVSMHVVTSQSVQMYMDDLKTAVVSFSQKANSLVIPDTVMADAWEYINCSYCSNSIEAFLNSNLSGKRITVEQAAGTLATAFGLDTSSITNIYRIELATGGYIEAEITLVSEPVSLRLEIIKVVDQNNNSVPKNSSSLQGLRVRTLGTLHINSINYWITPLNYFLLNDPGVGIVSGCPADPAPPHPCL